MIDISAVRADTPGCHDLIHFNNAGASLPTRQVVDAQVEYLRQEGRAGGYETADAYRGRIDGTYSSIARLIGADVGEIALTSNATESWQLAFGSFEFDEGDRILTAAAEYASNFIQYLRTRQRTGVSIEVIPSDEHGQTDAGALADMIDDRVKLISLTHIPTNGGLINPAAQIGSVAREAGIPFLLDACQSVGQIDLDVDAIGCDLLTATGRKYLRAPRGVGFLYVRRTFLVASEPLFLDLQGALWTTPSTYEMRDDARRYESWEFPQAAIVGLGMAVDYALDLGMDDVETAVVALGATLRERLTEIAGISVHDIGLRRCGIVTFSHGGQSATELVEGLHGLGINTSVTGRAATLIDATDRQLPDMVRASVHYYNTEVEIDRFVLAVRELTA